MQLTAGLMLDPTGLTAVAVH
eukprot:COSAG05_NODE_18196_length_312_cov_0.732394_1_plen_20_part_01